MNLYARKNNRLTFDDVCVMVPDGRKADLSGGVIYMASPDNLDAATLFGLLHAVMTFFVEEKELGCVFGPRVAFRINEAESPEPDVAFVRRDRRHLLRRGFVTGPPDLPLQSLSPTSLELYYLAN